MRYQKKKKKIDYVNLKAGSFIYLVSVIENLCITVNDTLHQSRSISLDFSKMLNMKLFFHINST